MCKVSDVLQNRYIQSIAILITLYGSCALVQAGQLYRYIDKNGLQVLSGHLPPEAAQGGYEVINDQTMLIIKRVPPAKTKQQLAKEARLAKIKAEKRRQAQKQANYDRILLATFSSEKDLLRARDNQLEAIEGLIKLAQGKLRTLQRKLRKYQDQAAHLERNGRPVFPKLLDNIQTIKNRLTNNQRYIEKKRQEKAAIRQKFAQDLKRFRELKQRIANSKGSGK